MNNLPNTEPKKKSKLREYIEALLTAIVIAFFIRSFIVEPFKIPSSSMIPTLLIGDHIFVNKFIYGLRIPFTKYRFWQFTTPKRGEVVVFIYPEDEKKDFIKRVVGLPGDVVSFKGTDVFVNGGKRSHEKIDVMPDMTDKRKLDVIKGDWKKPLPYFSNWTSYDFFKEEEDEVRHLVQYEKDAMWRSVGRFVAQNGGEVKVPEGHLFCIGDNRDNSSDGREWGFVPMENLKGKAMFVWLSLDNDLGWVRWKRFGTWIR